MCKIIATSMEERSKRLQHLLKRSEEMQVLSTDKTHSLPAGVAAELINPYGSSVINRELTQSEAHTIPKLDYRRRSLSAGKIAPTIGVHRRFSSVTAGTDDNNNFTLLHNRFASTDLPTSCSNLNFLGLHCRVSRDDNDADVESLCSTSELFAKRISVTSIDSNSYSRNQSTSPTNHLQSTKQHLSQLSDNERYLSDDEAYKAKRYNLTSLRYCNVIEPG